MIGEDADHIGSQPLVVWPRNIVTNGISADRPRAYQKVDFRQSRGLRLKPDGRSLDARRKFLAVRFGMN